MLKPPRTIFKNVYRGLYRLVISEIENECTKRRILHLGLLVEDAYTPSVRATRKRCPDSS